jgi:O-antigen/teichoic acid export membrane protein
LWGREIFLFLRKPSSQIGRALKYRSILGLLAGSGAAQVITLLSYPLLARLYSPADFGIYGGVMGVVAVLTAAMRMRADKLVLFTKVDNVRRDLLLAFLVLNVTGIAIGLGAIPLLRSLLPAASADLLILGVAAAAGTSLVHMLTGILSSALKTRPIVHSQFLRSIGTTLAQFGLFFLALGTLGLMIGTAVGLGVALLFLFRSARREELLPSFRGLNRPSFSYALRGQVPRLFWGSFQALAGSMTNAAPLIFAAAVFSPAMAGFYVMADRIVRVPVNLLATTIRSYVAVHARDEGGHPDIKFMITISLVMSGISLLVILPLLLFGEDIFVIGLGGRWAGTGAVAGILSIVMLFSFAALPCQAFVQSLGRSRELIYIELSYLAARILPMLYWGETLGLRGLAIVVVLSNLVYNGLYALYFIVSHKRGTLDDLPRVPEVEI